MFGGKTDSGSYREKFKRMPEMWTRKRQMLLFGAIFISALGIWASQNIVVRNLVLLMGYERTLDSYAQSDTTNTQITSHKDRAGREAGLISAFFGLDNGLPQLFGLASCRGAGGMDGMPVIFSHEVDLTTLEPGDFKITTASGQFGQVICLTMAPADDPGEQRTALLIGEFGSAQDQPVQVDIVGNVLSMDRLLNFRGAKIKVTPLESGPSLIWAEIVPQAHWALGRKATRLPWGGGDGCPTGTMQVVRVAWDGGVKKLDGTDADQDIGLLYKVQVTTSDGKTREVIPMALADLGDGDNNHALCLDISDPAISVRFPAGHLTDPRNDVNTDTMVLVTRTYENR
jgi:hypothetical protein